MRFDIFSVFPSYLNSLQLSLVGKASVAGAIDVQVHDLRDWTTDKHRTVDDTPVGGGAGMVMRADIWGKALDTAFVEDVGVENPRRILAIPTPAGHPLTQEICVDLAERCDQIVIACGRYEGIDSRVATHYDSHDDIEVFEYSLGDYVLNGGEVAALALVEAVARLVPGVIGNPESLVEESHGSAGLLEYPNYTRPLDWRGESVPPILTSGDHGRVARWRRDEALRKTALRRPDMIAALDASTLDRRDRAVLGQYGWYWPKNPDVGAHPVRPVTELSATPEVASHYSELARRTFPDACPQDMLASDIDAFMDAHLGRDMFTTYMESADWLLIGLRDTRGALIAYSLSSIPDGDGVAGEEDGAPVDTVLAAGPRKGPLIELSKFYLDRQWRGSGLAGMLMTATLEELSSRVREWERPYLWLGTNTGNKRARSLYTKLGFEKVGNRHFTVGEQNNDDIVMARTLDVTY
ncbi:tRNA (guanosine(37)-N1)-methyltransferase TrmD [Flaviflexus massiliensis]|uniref:tRNA (guanosine(37)-N1)-methyltransferase TrmD n=1 Tax=Flaviflexus massiliensis TaxID=1522309 RepID=UPI0006D550D7|nr:tRNA (guanosine(37)-N1)-methyltransferase TrmD [Flaviflexus massiliensis]